MKQIQPFQKHWLQLTSIVVCRLNRQHAITWTNVDPRYMYLTPCGITRSQWIDINYLSMCVWTWTCVMFQFLERVLVQSVVKLNDHSRQPVSRSNSLQSSSGSPSAESLQMSWVLKSPLYGHWSTLVGRLAKELLVDEDEVRRVHVVQLYSAGTDKLAEEVCSGDGMTWMA